MRSSGLRWGTPLLLGWLAQLGCTGSPPAGQKPLFGASHQAISAAAYSTFDATQGGCLDSPNGVNCNHYNAKTDVYLSGGPSGAALADGDYFFAILDPGSQNGGFLEGADGNLSDTTAGATSGDHGTGDALANRTFHVAGGVVTYTGTHRVGTSPDGHTVVQAAPFDDSANGEYALALCPVGATSPSDCKFDNFQVTGATDGGSDAGSPGPFDAGNGSGFGQGPDAGAPADRAPVALCKSLTACADNACGFSGLVDNGSYDPDGTPVTVTQLPAGPFTSGTTTVVLTASSNGLSSSCTTTVTVNDCTPPQISCPAPTTTECTGNAQATVATGSANASDNCGAPSVSGPGTRAYQLGTTMVAYTASDAAGNAASCSTSVTVVDTTPPTISCPAPVTAECTGSASATVVPAHATAADSCTDVQLAEPGAGSYPLGSTSVVYKAADTSGNRATCAASINVVDTTPPTISCPASVTAECTDHAQAVVKPGQASAADTCTGVTVSEPGAGSYALGTTSVAHTAQDGSGNTASCSNSVTVVDTTPPAIACPKSVTAECTGNNSAVVDSGHASAADICTSATVSDPAPASYPLGGTAVTHSAVDTSGNTSSCQNTVNVVDTTPPAVASSGGPELWPPDHKYVLVGLENCGVTVSDVCNGSLSLTQSGAQIVSVSSDEVVLATGVGSGHTEADIVKVDATHANLRAERAGTGDGRVYKIHFKAKDSSGNWSNGVCRVTVPHDQQPGHVEVDSGDKYVVTW